ncbi:hypothetical protein [Rhodococcus sp. NPDC058514]|uniref:hypothetical protein n=1 Tax=unclassified Rhodococcus (in: high G+C Gram-positive bacteria) TaxID=192944 RepID=UPI003661EDF0
MGVAVGERLVLDEAALRVVADGLAASSDALAATAGALRARGLDRLADGVSAWSAATFDDARRLADTVNDYAGQDWDHARALDGGHP